MQEALRENLNERPAELGFCFETVVRHLESVGAFQNFVDAHHYSCPGWYNLGNALAR